MTTIYFAGGEDGDHYNIGGGSVSTASGRFRSDHARCALSTISNPAALSSYWQNATAFSAAAFWMTGRLSVAGFGGTNNNLLIGFIDASGVVRLRLRATVSASPPFSMAVEKVNAAGTATSLGTYTQPNVSATTPDKFDFFINYAVAGAFQIYLNGVQLFSYSGDVTTDSVTALTGYRLGCCASNAALWSELIVSDTDTRSWSLLTFAPSANGNTHNFDTGTPAAANVNEVTLNDATLDGSTTAGQIDQYTVSSLLTGAYAVIAVGVSARAAKGVSGPSKVDLGLRTASTDYWSSDVTLSQAWTSYQNWWLSNPNTSAAWAASDLTAAGFNIGLKSVT